jgi:hypothetical protein
MGRTPSLSIAIVAACAMALAACNADLTDNCVAGPCGVDAGLDQGGSGGSQTSCFSDVVDCSANQPPKTGDIPCDVFEVLQRPLKPESGPGGGCHNCHKSPPINGAPYPLLVFADLQEDVGDKRKYQRMLEVIQPDRDGDGTPEGSPHMPLDSLAAQLSCDDATTLSGWLADCAPPDPEGTLESSGCCTPKTCEEVGATCGKAWDGCASYLDCDDGAPNGTETDVDCGGSKDTCITRCGVGQACNDASDCDIIAVGETFVSALCTGTPTTCQPPP